MKEIKKKTSEICVYSSESELDSDLNAVLNEARKTLKNSYSPYSKFRVGCALKLADGTVVTGTNQENIAYPSGLCAERVAIFSAGHNHAEIPPEIIAITASSEKGKVLHPPTSCGACLQVMDEYERRFGVELKIILSGQEGEVFVAHGVKTFMPWRFDTDLVG